MSQLTARSDLSRATQRTLITAAARGYPLDTALLGTLRAARDYAAHLIHRRDGLYLSLSIAAMPVLLFELRRRAQQELDLIDAALATVEVQR